MLAHEQSISPSMNNASAPPNYDELDSPPPYATLFPTTKADENFDALTSSTRGDLSARFHQHLELRSSSDTRHTQRDSLHSFNNSL